MNASLESGLTATLTPCEEGGYTAICKEVPGAISEGETKEEALSNLFDAVQAILAATNDLALEKLSRKGPSVFRSEMVECL